MLSIFFFSSISISVSVSNNSINKYWLLVAIWHSSQGRWSDQQSCSTPGLVNTGMGDRVGFNSRGRKFVTNQPGQLSLVIPLCG